MTRPKNEAVRGEIQRKKERKIIKKGKEDKTGGIISRGIRGIIRSV